MNTKTEKPKRLEPKPNVKRELFLLSRNECYYPSCPHKMMIDGDFVGQIVHIEDALPGGRFNERSNNEERRSFNNLMLMCYAHHVKTNDVNKFKVEDMNRMKDAHEQISENGIASMSFEAQDISQYNDSPPPENLKTYFEENDLLDLTQDQKAQSIDEAKTYWQNINMIPLDARIILASIIERAEKASYSSDMGLASGEINAVIFGITESRFADLIGMLDKYGFIEQGFDNEFGPGGSIMLSTTHEGWQIYKDLKELALNHQIELVDLLKNNALSLWDG